MACSAQSCCQLLLPGGWAWGQGVMKASGQCGGCWDLVSVVETLVSCAVCSQSHPMS